MKDVRRFLAFDLGASGGRAVVGEFEGRRFSCTNLYQFPNEPVVTRNSIYWDVLRLYREIQNGLALYVRQYGPNLDGLGIDTWGVDFGLLDRNGCLLGNPHHYRDRRTEGVPEEIRSLVGDHAIYRETGVQLEQVSTICQLRAMARSGSPQLDVAETMLMMPSLFSYFLTGEKLDEHSAISNTALLSYRTRNPIEGVMEKLGIPTGIMPEIARPGTAIGNLLRSVREDCGIGLVPVIAPATHDTASAVVSVPADPNSAWAFLSCGTWSIIGVESDSPFVFDESYLAGVTSAATAEGKYMPRLNITGLWILQECRRVWESQGDTLSWDEIVVLAEDAKPFAALIDVDDPAFVSPRDMPEAILSYLRKTGQMAPSDKGAVVRAVIESLALKHRDALHKLEALSGKCVDVLHMLGGGAKNKLLCRFTAEATGRDVLAGPIEASAVGNLMMQMVGAGIFASVSDVRQQLRLSFDLVHYQPENGDLWDEAYARYCRVVTDSME